MRTLSILVLCSCGSADRVDRFVLGTEAPGSDALAALQAIDIDIEAGDVHIVAADGPSDRIEVERTLRGPTGAVSATHRVVDGVAQLRGDCAMLAPCAVDLSLVVPEGLSVRIHTGSGAVQIVGRMGDVTVDVGDGEIAAHGQGAGGFSARVGWGDVTATFAATPADVQIASAAGDVTVMLPRGGYAIDAEGLGGATVMGLERSPSGPAVVVRAGSGRVTVGQQ